MNAVAHQVRLFFTALQFFTRLPVPAWTGFQEDWLRQALRYFPAIGWIVALLAALVYVLALRMWPAPVAVVLALAAGIWLTGAFHEDGFADICDGFGGGSTAERVLEIMRDSCIGAYGAVGLVVLLTLKLVLLGTAQPALALPALLLAHPVSRLAACSITLRLGYVRAQGKVRALAQPMRGFDFGIALATVLLPAALLAWFYPLPWRNLALALVLAGLATAYLAAMFRRRIGGYSGDCLGAVQQLAETAFYLGFTANL